MMMKVATKATLTLCVILLTTTLVSAAEAHVRAPELEKLEFLIGDWTVEGKAVPVKGSPPGLPTDTIPIATIRNEWSFPGKDFLITSGRFALPPDGREETYVRVIAYDQAKKAYTVHMVTSDGVVETMTFTIEGDVWTYHDIADNSLEQDIEQGKLNNRSLYEVLSPTLIKESLQWELGGKTWTTAIERIYIRKTKGK